eukprot:scaffold82596_cov17-Tisochrysis_lutea.AAC.1
MDRAELQWQLMQVQQQLADLQHQQQQQQQHQRHEQGWGDGPRRMVGTMGGHYAVMGGLSTVPPSPSHHSSRFAYTPAALHLHGNMPGSNDGSVGTGGGARDWQQAQ